MNWVGTVRDTLRSPFVVGVAAPHLVLGLAAVFASACDSQPCRFEVAPGVCAADAGRRDAATSIDASVDGGDAGMLGTDGGRDSGAIDGGPPPLRWTADLLPVPLDNTELAALRRELLPLPGGGQGAPVVTSNNPEVFYDDGTLYGTARALRGATPYPLSGTIGVYVHHLNCARTGAWADCVERPRYVSVLIENAGTAPVTVSSRGSGYTQDETGGLAVGRSPDYTVSRDWITQGATFNSVVPATTLAVGAATLVFQRLVNPYREVDGRFEVEASGPVHISVVSSTNADLASVRTAAAVAAPGEILTSGNPPPPYGREAGTYQFDHWRGRIELQVPPPGRRVGFMVNTATGTGFTQVQAFPALTHYVGSARESVGMYGNFYDLDLVLRHDGNGSAPRKVRVSFLGLSTASISRYWDGYASFDGVGQSLQSLPDNLGTPDDERVDVLGVIDVAPGATRQVNFRAMVPGLVSIPQAMYVESIP